MTKRPKLYDVDGIKVEIGPPISTDGGLVFVARRVRGSAWFKALLPSLRAAIAEYPGQRFGFAAEGKLARTLLALICGFAMGYRSGKEIADVIEADKLWRKVLGARVPQIDLSRLVGMASEAGLDVLRVAVLASASEGVEALHLDGDSSLLALHGKQEGGAFNGHYKEFGYHAGWMLEASGRLAALWLNEGNAHTAEGQAEKLAWMLDQGARIGSYRGDAGMPSPRLMDGLEAMGATYAMRLRSNARLDEAAQAICPELPKVGGAVAFSEFQHAVKSWVTDRRVVVKFQVPETKDGAAALFAESLYIRDQPQRCAGLGGGALPEPGRGRAAVRGIRGGLRAHLPPCRDGQERSLGAVYGPGAQHAGGPEGQGGRRRGSEAPSEAETPEGRRRLVRAGHDVHAGPRETEPRAIPRLRPEARQRCPGARTQPVAPPRPPAPQACLGHHPDRGLKRPTPRPTPQRPEHESSPPQPKDCPAKRKEAPSPSTPPPSP